MPDSVFNQPVTNWAVDPNSSAYVTSLLGQIKTPYNNFGVAANDPLYVVPGGTPLSTVTVANHCNDFIPSTGTQVPVPANYSPSSGTDLPVFLVDPSLNKVWEFWEFNEVTPGTFSACWGGAATLSTFTGVFPYPYGESATGISYAATAVSAADVASGQIDHTIAMTLEDCASSVAPADRTDCSDNAAGVPHEGQVFRFAPGTQMPKGLNAFAQMVFEAGLKYGFVVTDHSGAIEISADEAVNNSKTWGGLPEYQVINSLPWNDLQAVDPPQS